MYTEVALSEKCKIVKQSLYDFLTSQIPNADLNAVDDVIFTYVHKAIEEVESTPDDLVHHGDELVDILTAYVQDFNKIEREAAYVWLMDIVGRLAEEKEEPYMDEAAKPEEKLSFKDVLSFQIPKDSPTKYSNNSTRSNSTSDDDFKFPESADEARPTRQELFESAIEAAGKKHGLSQTPEAERLFTTHIDFLMEIFPDSTAMEIKNCLSIARGDVERALATLIHRRERGDAAQGGALGGRGPRARATGADEIKNRIIQRYSYVDRESETKEHKPLAPKHAPKKMVRYRDNKIVSLKGERYTEVSKNDEEGVKKSNKKHHP